MQVRLEDACVTRGGWRLAATGTFGPGVHLVSGPVGSGKTTLAMVLAGLIPPEGGLMTAQGIGSRVLSMQFPEYHVTEATVADEVRSWGADPAAVLADAGLAGRGEEDPFVLSRGELKYLHLLCVLGTPRDLLILDEPFSSLDCVRKQQICRRLRTAAAGILVIFTHEQAVLPRADRIWEMEEGRLSDRGAIPSSLPAWKGAPRYLRYALDKGIVPANIRIADVEEALCRTRD